MGNKVTNSEDILIKVDHNNLMYIDPNSVYSNGVVQSRSVEHENLVMYVNLEADLIPRTTLISDNNVNTLTSVAKGTLNFLKNENGKDYDSTWTDGYTDFKVKKNNTTTPTDSFQQYDGTGQNFGIDTVQVKTAGLNGIPQVDIRFIDVRGKTLMESPSDSPYKSFFHIPYPIFYLTIKGYYGKAVKYRLNLVNFSCKFNSSNGNFEIDATFLGSTFTYLRDINWDAVLNAPYMFGITNDTTTTFNPSTGFYEKKLSKTTKGYQILTSVYNEYKEKGLIPKDFPVKTLREVIVIARRLNKILESQIFATVAPPEILSAVKNYEELLTVFESTITAWSSKYLSQNFFTITGDNTLISGVSSPTIYYKLSSINKSSLTDILGITSNHVTLEGDINNYVKQLNNNAAFGSPPSSNGGGGRDVKKLKGNKNDNTTFDLTTVLTPISLDKLTHIKNYYKIDKYGNVGVAITNILEDIATAQKQFVEQRDKFQKTVEDKMNEIIKNKDTGIGFEPTIRNLVGLVMANADTYIRLMTDVHQNAFNVADKRKKILKSVNTDSIGDSIYPWPEIKKPSSGNKQNEVVYPGSTEMIKLLGSDDPVLWPEVDFVENFYAIATKKIDPLSEKEGDDDPLNFVFETNSDFALKKDISTLTYLNSNIPYLDKSISSIFYEIWERAKYCTTVDSFTNNSLTELAKIEFDNIKNVLGEDYDIIDILKTKITANTDIRPLLLSYSPFQKYPYYEDQLPTVPYITNTLKKDYKLVDYPSSPTLSTNFDSSYPNLINNLNNYVPETYRSSIYPFSSPTYLTYLNKSKFTINDLKPHGILQVNTKDGFITSPLDPYMWVKDGFENNLFTNTISINGSTKHILNTPYFHNQLYNDYFNNQVNGKYAASAYLLLNSLPFFNLNDTISYSTNINWSGLEPNTDVLMSSVFREIGASHFIPYHLMVKWGAIYHRYKNYLLNGVDIIDGITTPITNELFFDNFLGRTYNLIDGKNVDIVTKTNVGFNPYYQNIFYQIINGTSFYDQSSINAVTSYSNTINSGIINLIYDNVRGNFGGYTWTAFIDNSISDNTDLSYTFLPSNGNLNTNLTSYQGSIQENYKILWSIGDNSSVVYSGQTFPAYNEYNIDINNVYSLSNNNKKVLDLIATFKPDILDDFESEFLNFSSQLLNEEIPVTQYNVQYNNFQSLLSDLVNISKDTTDPIGSDKHDLVSILKNKQILKLQSITNTILDNSNLIKITLSNPKEIDTYIMGGFTKTSVKTYNIEPFYIDDVTSNNLKLIELYLGYDTDSNYQNFFSINNVRLTEQNIKSFRFLIYIYAGYINAGNTNTNSDFVNYLIRNVINKNPEVSSKTAGTTERLSQFLKILFGQFNTLNTAPNKQIDITRGYNDDPIKNEFYYSLKHFNDIWISGNVIGQRTLMEEFIFLDIANIDIGDKLYLSMDRLLDIAQQPNKNKLNLFDIVVLLVKNSGIDIRPLPAYVNWYGTNYNDQTKIIPSKNVAKNIFGTFLEVDYQDAAPKMILQYTGPLSKHLDLTEINNKYFFKNDTFDISNQTNNPILTNNNFLDTDFTKSNKAVAFEVSFGDQQQGIFKGIQLDQTSIKNTSESYKLMEQLGNSETGSSTAQLDTALFDIYRSRSYSCEVTCMGNVMIQPTMYFYLKNIPLFRGTYIIYEVTHNIKTTGIETTFKGSRLSSGALPDPKDSFSASYRALFDKITTTAVAKIQQKSLNPTGIQKTEKTFVSSGISYTYNMGSGGIINGETFISSAGITEYGIPYNGFYDEEYVQLISYNGANWLRAQVLEMGGATYNLDGKEMSILSRYNYGNSNTVISWDDIKNSTKTLSFYSSKFLQGQVNANTIIDNFPKTHFLNPKNGTTVTITSSADYINKKFTGPVNSGPNIPGYGIGLSRQLLNSLGLHDGDVVYFTLSQ